MEGTYNFRREEYRKSCIQRADLITTSLSIGKQSSDLDPGCFPGSEETRMSESLKSRRPWKEIAMDLIAEKGRSRFGELAQELNDALAAEGLGNRSQNQPVENNPYRLFLTREWISDLLASAIEASNADAGTVQLLDSSSQVLRIAAQSGFEKDFLEYFETVRCGDGCVCGAAMSRGARVLVTDVAADPLLQLGAREVLLRAGLRSVQSTPLLDASGVFIGMLSTHYKHAPISCPPAWKGLDDVVARYMAEVRLAEDSVR